MKAIHRRDSLLALALLASARARKVYPVRACYFAAVSAAELPAAAAAAVAAAVESAADSVVSAAAVTVPQREQVQRVVACAATTMRPLRLALTKALAVRGARRGRERQQQQLQQQRWAGSIVRVLETCRGRGQRQHGDTSCDGLDGGEDTVHMVVTPCSQGPVHKHSDAESRH